MKNDGMPQERMPVQRAQTMAQENDEMDAMLNQALQNFRQSVDAWSDAAYSRPRRALVAAPRRSVWRLVAGWALGCALLAASVSGGFYVRHEQKVEKQAKLAAAREAEHERLQADLRAREEQNLLARVDSDVSRDVPSALEPLAALMEDGSSE